jgi:hypothetical protein
MVDFVFTSRMRQSPSFLNTPSNKLLPALDHRPFKSALFFVMLLHLGFEAARISEIEIPAGRWSQGISVSRFIGVCSLARDALYDTGIYLEDVWLSLVKEKR